MTPRPTPASRTSGTTTWRVDEKFMMLLGFVRSLRPFFVGYKIVDFGYIIGYYGYTGNKPDKPDERKESFAMGQTVELYKWENFKAVKGWDRRHGFALVGERLSFEFVGNIGDPEEYILPEGYSFEESPAGYMAIYDDRNQECEIEHSNGLPVLVSTQRVVLEKKIQ